MLARFAALSLSREIAAADTLAAVTAAVRRQAADGLISADVLIWDTRHWRPRFLIPAADAPTAISAIRRIAALIAHTSRPHPSLRLDPFTGRYTLSWHTPDGRAAMRVTGLDSLLRCVREVCQG